uniref:Retrovirus-related Pol polyprotein from transposon TNT 1-94 n=1 Tax=Tanacetum cinerariifolium TaxID=118510 RepID=A0A6L2MIU1_TANCI|nr:retrovirus-related Pol polyprotein from transposon TNT 1-94 [Tanacetum cinerariifolium]
MADVDRRLSILEEALGSFSKSQTYRGQIQGEGYGRGKESEQKQVEIMLTWQPETPMTHWLCCVENMVKDRIMDSGSSFNATYCKEELERFKQCSGKTLKDVRYIPGLKRKLISVRQLDEEGYHIGFGDQQWKVTKCCLVVAHRNKCGSMYMVKVHPERIGIIIDGSGNAALQHQRLGGISRIGMNMLAFKHNIPDVQKVDIYFCKPGGLGKKKKLSFIMSEKIRKLQRSCGRVVMQKRVPETTSTVWIRTITRLSEAEILHLWTRFIEPVNDGIVVEHGLSSEITMSLGGSSDTSEGSKTVGDSRIVEDQMKNTVKTENPLRRKALRIHWQVQFRRTSLTGFPAQSIRSSNAIALDSPYLLVLVTGTSQNRQHGLLHYLMECSWVDLSGSGWIME